MKQVKVCGIVGQQPASLPFGYNMRDSRAERLREALKTELEKLIQDGYCHFLCPMNEGAELLAAELIEEMQDEGCQITLTAVLPFETQAADWVENERERFFEAVRRCSEEKLTNNRYDDTAVVKNLEYIIDMSDCLLAIRNGSPSYISYAVSSAKQKGKQVIGINPDEV